MSFVGSEVSQWGGGSEESLNAHVSEASSTLTFRVEVDRRDARPLLIEDVDVCHTLRRIVSRLSADPALQQDMLQECLTCLWKSESNIPGQTLSWYLQRCRFHVQHWLFLGRSVDSPKRAGSANRIAVGWDDTEPALDDYHTNGELLDTVCVRDLVVTLARHLGPRERAVLDGLVEGFVLREIAFKSRLSYPTAIKYRRRIAALALKLGVCAPRKSRKTAAKSAKPK